eukprot:tig00020851_g14708.t1
MANDAKVATKAAPDAKEDGAGAKNDSKPAAPAPVYANGVVSIGGLLGLIAFGFFCFVLVKEHAFEEEIELEAAKARELYFTPVQSSIGGLLIGLSVFFMLRLGGRVTGISGMLSEFLFGGFPAWRFFFLFGLFFTGAWLYEQKPSSFDFARDMSASFSAVAGFLVGFGALMGNGCTSGHMICGMSRLSPRSLAATVMFFLGAVGVNAAFRDQLGGLPATRGIAKMAPYPDEERMRFMLTALVGVTGTYLVLWAVSSLKSIQESSRFQRFLMNVVCLVSGGSFGLGLGLSGMLRSSKVLGFVDVTGKWDPSLVCVAGGAVVPNMILYFAHVKGLSKPALAPAFAPCSMSSIDLRLLAGSLIFGIGWGLGGVCPGPIIAAVPSLEPHVLFAGLGMLAGMFAFRFGHMLVGGAPSAVPKAAKGSKSN